VVRESHGPFLALAATAGLASWASARSARAKGFELPTVPGARWLQAFLLLVLFQLLPLPPRLLYFMSPRSYEFHRSQPQAQVGAWWPISASPRATQRTALFVASLSLFYAAVFREYAQERRAKRLCATVVGVGCLMTLIGFVQRASDDPGLIYGVWRVAHAPDVQAAAFGPYGNRSHYAGYVVMAVPLALGAAAEAFEGVRRIWRRRAKGFTALGEPDAAALVLQVALVGFMVAGILTAGSRTGVVACAVGIAAAALAFGRRLAVPALAAVAVAGACLVVVDVDWFWSTFNRETLRADRVVLWRDMAKIVPDFPVFGVGFNALGPVYRWRYQTIYDWGWWGEAHDEYYEMLLDGGLCGAVIGLGLVASAWRAAWRVLACGALGAGLFGAVAANATSNLTDFNLQIPANAATFAAIVGVTAATARRDAPSGSPDAAAEVA
jgi:hypothetical protein